MPETKLKTLYGHDIYVTDDGKFKTVFGRIEMTRSKLVDLEREIAKTAQAVDGMIASYAGHCSKVRVTGIEKTDRWGGSSFRLENRQIVGTVYRFDAEKMEQINALATELDEAKKAFDAKHYDLTCRIEDIRKTLTHLTADDLIAKKGEGDD